MLIVLTDLAVLIVSLNLPVIWYSTYFYSRNFHYDGNCSADRLTG